MAVSIFLQVVRNNRQIFYADLHNVINELSGRVTPDIKVTGPHYREAYKSLPRTSTIFVAEGALQQ